MVLRRYLFAVIGGIAGILVAIAAITFVVDPYGIFQAIMVDGFNAEKHQRYKSGGRATKSIDLWVRRYDTVILGTSRTQVGIDPASARLLGGTVYNASLNGTNMREVYEIGVSPSTITGFAALFWVSISSCSHHAVRYQPISQSPLLRDYHC